MSRLLSEDYRKLQKKLHDSGDYGLTAHRYGWSVSNVAKRFKIKSILDYGCGVNLDLLKTLDTKAIYRPYDPCVPDYSESPEPAEMVVCIDVLEHIEPECLESVLNHLRALTERILFVTVCMTSSSQYMQDGRNVHLIQKPREWWIPKFADRFAFMKFATIAKTHFAILAKPK